MNTENINTNESKKFFFEFTNKVNLKDTSENIALVNLSIFCTWKNIKSAYNSNKFRIFAPA